MCVTHDDLDKIREKIELEVEKFHNLVSSHAREEVAILNEMKSAISTISSAQRIFELKQDTLHNEINNNFNKIKPVEEGFSAARTVGKVVLWIAGITAGISLIIVEWGRLLKR